MTRSSADDRIEGVVCPHQKGLGRPEIGLHCPGRQIVLDLLDFEAGTLQFRSRMRPCAIASATPHFIPTSSLPTRPPNPTPACGGGRRECTSSVPRIPVLTLRAKPVPG